MDEKMKSERKVSVKKDFALFTAMSVSWLFVILWLMYNATMLWQLKQQNEWNASICKVSRQ